MLAPDILKIDVNAVRTGPLQRPPQIARLLIIDRRVHTRDLLQPACLGLRTRRTHHAAALDLRDLAHLRAHRARRARHEHRLPLLRRPNVQQPDIGRHPRHTQHAQVALQRPKRRIDLCQMARLRQRILPPPEHMQHKITLRKRLAVRADHLAHRAARERFIQPERSRIAARIPHPPPHIRVHRDKTVAHQHLARLARPRHLDADERKIVRSRQPVRPAAQVNLTAGNRCHSSPRIMVGRQPATAAAPGTERKMRLIFLHSPKCAKSGP